MCEYTEDYEDEPHGIVCAEIEGENVLIDVDVYMEGYDPNESRCPCPNCDLSAHTEYMIDSGLVESAHKHSYKKHMAVAVAERVAANQALRSPKQLTPQPTIDT